MGIMRLSTIRTLYGGAGPWASVYLDATGYQQTGSTHAARQELGLRWRGARESLERHGADEPTLRAIDEAVREVPSSVGPAEVVVFASGGTVAFTRTLPVTPRREMASWSAQPHAADLLRGFDSAAANAARGAPPEEVRWVRADVDRIGGSVQSSDGAVVTVRGQDEFITKVNTMERDQIWSVPKFQRAAEEDWDRNSADIARVISAAVERTAADVIVLTGDIRARQLVIDRLPPILAGRVVELDHESQVRPHPESRNPSWRQPYAYDPVVDAATQTADDLIMRGRRSDALDRFHNALSQGNSVTGVEPVCAAARELRIDTLLLSAEPSSARVWVDPQNPTMLGPAKKDTGATSPAWEPADESLVGAAAMAAADSIVIDGDPDLVDGVGAILRYPL